jgi:transposase
MIGSTRSVRVWVHEAPTDMRKSFDTLGALVRGPMSRDLLSGDIFLFVGKTKKRAKAIYWDGTGLCVFAKRLEKGRFYAPWERRRNEVIVWTTSELALFLEGSDVVGRVALSPPIWVRGEMTPRRTG